MAKTKVYEVEATITMNYCFEVDATSKENADDVARELLNDQMARISRDYYDSYDIDIESVEESEGH